MQLLAHYLHWQLHAVSTIIYWKLPNDIRADLGNRCLLVNRHRLQSRWFICFHGFCLRLGGPETRSRCYTDIRLFIWFCLIECKNPKDTSIYATNNILRGVCQHACFVSCKRYWKCLRGIKRKDGILHLGIINVMWNVNRTTCWSFTRLYDIYKINTAEDLPKCDVIINN